MMFGKIKIQDEVKIRDEVLDLFERYGTANTKKIFDETLASYKGSKKEENPEPQPQTPQPAAPQTAPAPTQPQPPQPPEEAPNLPPNVKTLEEFIESVKEVVKTGKVNPEYKPGIIAFVQGAQAIMKNDFGNTGFIMSLTAGSFGDMAISNPYEDWIVYNGERVRKILKKYLRQKGYHFLDSEAELGKTFDKEVHNCIRKEQVTNPALDNRVLKVLSEGLVIDNELHINCDVVVGIY